MYLHFSVRVSVRLRLNVYVFVRSMPLFVCVGEESLK